jgi:hypothetical protein
VVANWWTPAQAPLLQLQEGPLGSVGHACQFETSMMLVLAPDRVDMSMARDDGRLHAARFRCSPTSCTVLLRPRTGLSTSLVSLVSMVCPLSDRDTRVSLCCRLSTTPSRHSLASSGPI